MHSLKDLLSWKRTVVWLPLKTWKLALLGIVVTTTIAKHGLVSRSIGYATSLFHRTSSRNLSVSSPIYGSFFESCFLCKKPLEDNRDIFMYRGDIPFCSVECRQEQIESDEAKELEE
ncbi:hypothetical protein K1719_001830 [Acacia pycnantha]|nr:hypothetical protein K1719_001830 [Acacia pycnantha]